MKAFALAVAALAVTSSFAAAETIALKDSPDWTVSNFNRAVGPSGTGSTNPSNTPGISYGYEAGPSTPPVGSDSFFANIGTEKQKVFLSYTGINGVALSDLEEMSFWTYIDSASGSKIKANNDFNWYANLWVDANGDGSYNQADGDNRLDFEATTTGFDTWTKFNLLDAVVLNSRGSSVPRGNTLASFIAANPDAMVSPAFGAAGQAGLILNMGDTGNTYEGFVGNLDAITIDLAGSEATVFDLTAASAVPEPMAALGGLSLLSLVGLRRRTLAAADHA